MPYALAVLRRDSNSRLPELEAILPQGPEQWQELTLAIVAHEYDVEVVMLAQGNAAIFGDRAELTEFVTNARLHLFGASVSLALVTDAGLSRRIVDQAASVRLWVDTAVRAGISDFFEIPEEVWSGDFFELPGEILRYNLDRCRENRQTLLDATKGDLRGSIWKTRSLSRRLNRLLPEEHVLPADSSSVRFTVIDVPMGSAQLQIAPADGATKYVEVLALLRCAEKPALRDYRTENGIGPVLTFSTELETLFFARAFKSWEKAPTGLKSSLVISNSFDPERDPELVIAGSKDIGEVLEAVGPHVKYCVVRRNSPERLVDSIQTELIGDHVVWLHLGHGVEEHGLEDFDGGIVENEIWVQVFRSSGKELLAAMLLACDSEGLVTALRSALPSVQYCIGFRGKLGPDDARTLAAAMLPALLRDSPKEDLQRSYLRAVDSMRLTGSTAVPFVNPAILGQLTGW